MKENPKWAEIRHATAHGFEGFQLTLAEYVEFEAFVVLSMNCVADQCWDRFKLEL
jgi:hypothetical protein